MPIMTGKSHWKAPPYIVASCLRNPPYRQPHACIAEWCQFYMTSMKDASKDDAITFLKQMCEKIEAIQKKLNPVAPEETTVPAQ